MQQIGPPQLVGRFDLKPHDPAAVWADHSLSSKRVSLCQRIIRPAPAAPTANQTAYAQAQIRALVAVDRRRAV